MKARSGDPTGHYALPEGMEGVVTVAQMPDLIAFLLPPP